MLKFTFSPEEDIKMHARIARLESVLEYGTDRFESNASYSRFATFARMAPTVFKAHGDFIADITGLYAEHSVQKQVRNEKITAGEIDSTPLKARETVVEHSSGSGFNFFLPTSVVAPICDGNIREAIDSFWRQSSLLTSTHALLHSRKGAEIAANGISTALSAYSSITTILDYGTGGTASLFGIGSFGFYSTESCIGSHEMRQGGGLRTG